MRQIQVTVIASVYHGAWCARAGHDVDVYAGSASASARRANVELVVSDDDHDEPNIALSTARGPSINMIVPPTLVHRIFDRMKAKWTEGHMHMVTASELLSRQYYPAPRSLLYHDHLLPSLPVVATRTQLTERVLQMSSSSDSSQPAQYRA